jgi:pseudouridine synthase
MEERLQKIMAEAGLGSRRHNEELIAAGRVKVNGRPARLGDKADPAVDRIEVDGQPLAVSQENIYVLLNKPRNVLSSLEDELESGRTTVRELIPLAGHLYPVGRLDKQSEGLMLLTNDGELAHLLTHPRYGHEKSYRVLIEGQLSPAELDSWRRGVMLDGEMTAPAGVEIESAQADHSWLRVTMREGRKRQIRRIAAQLGHAVNKLVRDRIGPLTLGELKPGEWRHLSEAELQALRNSVGGRRPRPSRKQLKRKKESG